jgi:hypothetical protein
MRAATLTRRASGRPLVAEQLNQVVVGLDQTPTLWVAPCLRAIERPQWDVGPRRCDYILVEAGTQRVYRILDRYWLGYLGAAYARSLQQAMPEATRDALAQRWALILSWARERHGEPWVAHCAACPPPSDYPAPTLRDRWCDTIVTWRRRHSELPS